MGDDKNKDKKAPPKEKKPTPFRNGMIIGLIIGGFLGLLVDTPAFMKPIKDPIVATFQGAKKEAATTVGSTVEQAGKKVSETGSAIKQEGNEKP